MRKLIALISLSIIAGIFSPVAAHAVTSFNCPSGGGSYQVTAGVLTGTTGTCSGNLTLDSSVTTIDTYSLDSAQLTTLTIPATVTSIVGAPYSSQNSSLTAINVDSANPNFSSDSGVLFNKAKTELIKYPSSRPGTTYVIPASVTSIRYYGFSGNLFLTSLAIPNTLTTLGGQVFLSAQALTTISIGTGLSALGDQSFADISTLTAINVDAANTSFASIDGVLYNKNITTLYAYPNGKSGTTFTAPNTVTSTRYTAFGYNNPNLVTVSLPGLSSLSGQEFEDAISLQEVTFGNALTDLKSQVFQGDAALKIVTFGTGLTHITDGAFYGNTSLYCVVYPGSNASVQNYAYPNVVVPVASRAGCLQPPAFTISSTRESVVKNSRISGYTISSTGGAIASYAISPSLNNGTLTFSTSTGLITGTPTTVSSQVYTITGHNAARPDATATFTLNVTEPAPIPDPVQLSKITSMTPTTSTALSPTSVVVTGTFIEKISNIQINGTGLTAGSWVQTPTTISFTIPGKAAGTYSIQIFNGSAPIMAAQLLTVTPVKDLPSLTGSKQKVTYIRCAKPGHGTRVAYGVNPVCPAGYTRR